IDESHHRGSLNTVRNECYFIKHHLRSKLRKQQLRNKWDLMKLDHQHMRELFNCAEVKFNSTIGYICADDD
ncbi:Hypothetical predicted protein, partial [Olea europaea subsp. europaea]